MKLDSRVQLNRLLVGVLAILSLLGGVTIIAVDSMENMWGASFIRVGLLLGAFWIGMPTKGRAAAWANVSPYWIVMAVAALVFIVRRPQVFVFFGVALFVLAVVAPLLTSSGKR